MLVSASESEQGHREAILFHSQSMDEPWDLSNTWLLPPQGTFAFLTGACLCLRFQLRISSRQVRSLSGYLLIVADFLGPLFVISFPDALGVFTLLFLVLFVQGGAGARG